MHTPKVSLSLQESRDLSDQAACFCEVRLAPTVLSKSCLFRAPTDHCARVSPSVNPTRLVQHFVNTGACVKLSSYAAQAAAPYSAKVMIGLPKELGWTPDPNEEGSVLSSEQGP